MTIHRMWRAMCVGITAEKKMSIATMVSARTEATAGLVRATCEVASTPAKMISATAEVAGTTAGPFNVSYFLYRELGPHQQAFA